jgi:PAS domain S-box-containing protein
MLRPDVGTLALAAAMTSMACGIIVAVYGAARHQDRRWSAFSASALLYGLGLLLVILRASLPVALSIMGGNLLLVLSAVAAHMGAVQLAGGGRPWPFYGLTLALFLGLEGHFLYGHDDINARIAVVSLVRVPLFAHAAWLIRARLRQERNGGLAALGAVLALWGFILVPRSLGALFLEGPIHEFAALVGVQAMYFAASGLGYVAVVAALLVLDSERIAGLLDHEVSRQAEALETQIARQVQNQERLRQSEADLRAILDNMPDIFYRTDRDGRLLMISRSVESQLGYRVDELLGRDAGLYHCSPDSRAQMIADIEAAGGSIVDYEVRMRHKDGRELWAATSSRFYHDADGRVAGVEGVLRLIEERKRSELYVRESQALIQAMLDASSDAIMLISLDGTMLAVNEVMAERFGARAADLSGKCLWDMFPPDVAKARQVAVGRAVETGDAIHYLDQRGDLYLDNSIYPVPGADGRPDKVAVYSRDITAQTLAEAKVQTYLAELERSNAELEQFAYVASHDLREPLRMISSYLSLLERRYGPNLDQDGLEFLGFARDGAQRMDRLVLDLLEFSRIDRKGAPMVDMEVEPALQQALRHLAPAIAEGNVAVEILAGGDSPRVMGDPDQIVRLFQNLIGNAVKYRAAGRPARVSVSWRRDGKAWLFQVTDNGIGIEAQYFERIFRIFQRLHTADQYEGTGIGLAICKKIVERHSGRIAVDSVPGEGTTISFTLPTIP